ncbi:hypothetical protein ACIBQX_38070 [Nonomuraea sp. NPDC049714]|uniref:hypothetical protein n=1 Tax=Nonomuraea sp. NPDC049714 TaxID=3364357 RepID=UPI00378B434D
MTRSLLLVSLAAGALTVPMPASSAATELAIRQINVRPAAPVVGAGNSVRLVIDVVAKGVSRRDGVSVKVEPGAPPGPDISPTGEPSPSPRPPSDDSGDPGDTGDSGNEPSSETWDKWSNQDEPSSEDWEDWSESGDSSTDTRDESRGEPSAEQPAKPPTGAKARPDAESPTGDRSAKERKKKAPRAGSSDDPAEKEVSPSGSEGESSAEGRSPSGSEGESSAEGRSPSGAGEDSSGEEVPPSGSGDDSSAEGVSPPGAAEGSPADSTEEQAAPSEPVKAGAGQATQEVPALEQAASARPVWRAVPSPMRMRDGWQTWRFLPDKALNRYYPAGTWTITATAKGPNGTSVTSYASFQLKRESKLGSVRVARAGDAQGVRLSGSLTRLDPRGAAGFSPFARQRVEILWRQDSSGTWQRVAEATTTANGAFRRTVSGRAGGEWRVRYLGTGHYAADASRVQQISQ